MQLQYRPSSGRSRSRRLPHGLVYLTGKGRALAHPFAVDQGAAQNRHKVVGLQHLLHFPGLEEGENTGQEEVLVVRRETTLAEHADYDLVAERPVLSGGPR
jgi:hypothetical protein